MAVDHFPMQCAVRHTAAHLATPADRGFCRKQKCILLHQWNIICTSSYVSMPPYYLNINILPIKMMKIPTTTRNLLSVLGNCIHCTARFIHVRIQLTSHLVKYRNECVRTGDFIARLKFEFPISFIVVLTCLRNCLQNIEIKVQL